MSEENEPEDNEPEVEPEADKPDELPFVVAMTSEVARRVPPGMRYIMGKHGLMVQRNSPLFISSVPAEADFDHLASVPHGVMLRTPRIPAALIEQALAFFTKVDDLYRGEAALILLYNPSQKTFHWYCPDQISVGMNVRITYPTAVPPGMVVFGDFHSHPGMSPTPSMTDEEDEVYRAGLHLIAGYVGCKKRWYNPTGTDKIIEISSTFSIDGKRVTLETDDVLEAVPQPPFGEFPQEWMDHVTEEKWSWKKDKDSWKDKPYKGKSRDIDEERPIENDWLY